MSRSSGVETQGRQSGTVKEGQGTMTSSIFSNSWKERERKTTVITPPFFVSRIKSLPIRIAPD